MEEKAGLATNKATDKQQQSSTNMLRSSSAQHWVKVYPLARLPPPGLPRVEDLPTRFRETAASLLRVTVEALPLIAVSRLPILWRVNTQQHMYSLFTQPHPQVK